MAQRSNPEDRAKPRRSAYDRALGLLARREHSARELETKLTARGVATGEAAQAVGQLKNQRYQSDERFAESLARGRAAQGYGPLRIRAELKSHGLAEASIRKTLAALAADWPALAAAQLRRHYGAMPAADAAGRARRAQFLLRRGFDAATVRAITRAEAADPGDGFD